MPAGARTGLPGEGPRGLESVLKRRLNSQNGVVRPASVVTWYASPQWRMAVTRRSLPACFRSLLEAAPLIPPLGASGACPAVTALREAIRAARRPASPTPGKVLVVSGAGASGRASPRARVG